ncbi:MAG: hypothetical protein BV456_01775 [Thermoplasmata archaeon M8B2D]|nr:MAG: hypothetical protein BV456_01775 [Thermoplasmata archaeon M8B2D]
MYLSYDDKKEIKDEIGKIKNYDFKSREPGFNSITERILNTIFSHKNHGKEDKSDYEKENGNYPYVPFNRGMFTQIIVFLQKKYHKKSFIDVGCGIGDKVILAEIFGDFKSVTGIELNTTTYHVAKYFIDTGLLPFQRNEDYFKKEMLHGHEIFTTAEIKREILNINAFDYDFSQHDFIYMYSPISDNKILKKLYLKILKEMPIGGILLEVLGPEIIVNVIKKEFKNLSLKNNSKYDSHFVNVIIERTETGFNINDVFGE